RGYTLARIAELDYPQRALLPGVMKRLKDEEPEVVDLAFRVLAQYGSEAHVALPQLIQMLGEPKRRSRVLDYLRFLGPLPKDAVPLLVKFLKDKDLNVSSKAVHLLEAMGPAAAAAVPELTKALHNSELQRDALRALGAVGAAAKPAVPEIVKL